MKNLSNPSRLLATVLFIGLIAATTAGCTGERPSLGLVSGDGGLLPCPESPNCVSNDASDEEHKIEPLVLAVAPDAAWKAVHEVLASMPRMVIIEDNGSYLHAEQTSRLMRYVDDLELAIDTDKGIIAVRSASRLGKSDLGVNRERVEFLRAALVERGAVR